MPDAPAALRVRVSGALDQATVETFIAREAEAIASCRERPDVKIDLELDIAADGKVTLARSPKFPDREKTADCLTHRARYWTFPSASGTSRVTIMSR